MIRVWYDFRIYDSVSDIIIISKTVDSEWLSDTHWLLNSEFFSLLIT